MKNTTKYPQTYLDRLLPNASCSNCTSSHVTRDTVREINNGEHISVSHICDDCKIAFIVRYNMQYLRINQKKQQEMISDVDTKTNTRQFKKKSMKKCIDDKKIKMENYMDKRRKDQKAEEIPMDSKSRKKMLYSSVSRGFNIASIVSFFTCCFMISYEVYDLTVNYNNNSIYNILVIFIIMIGLLVITQLFSIIYNIIGR